ncbi:hypothetical protein B0H14DRAFT_3095663 [Mycena olivaceomarginata]|nr:hypothetical protein B0H14DRAFT_3095663 [Mycena olivaceomarginata]
MPCAPWDPTVAINIRVLETYLVTHVHCPHLAVQAFVKSLCDIHGVHFVPYRPYLCQQFSIAYDLYLDIRRRTDERVMKALDCDSTWRMKHACPACMYKLEGEDALIFAMLTTMDGNDSLKRVLRRDKSSVGEDETGELTLAKSREWEDSRDSRLGDRLPMQAANTDEDNPCAEWWKNMINDVTSKMWGIFDETGIFLALCRHGFVLVIADMIKSGELAKYPLAVVKELLGAFGMKLGAGYDVGCHFQATVANSELGPEAKEKQLRCLVGSFHGHAHNCLCQLRFLATYVEGMGLKDLEGCERFFSRSNGLAKSCRYASRFHRQQEITIYAKHFDSFETYANLSKFLCNNYRQALGILKTAPALRAWMRQEGVAGVETFHEWLEEEKTYLLGLKAAAKTNTETLEMEYIQKLVNLGESQRVMELTDGISERSIMGDDGTYAPGVGKAEMARRHAQEKAEKDLEQVQELESILAIAERWTTESPKWVETVAAIKQRKYQLALNGLELLIVERIFELTKMNQSETGYKMRKHIAKALQARSKAVKNTIDRYNDAAAMLEPPMPVLTWEEVSRPWTRPAYRLAMDRYFKTLRVREEIKRLNIEIQQVVTWIQDEDRFLRRMEANLQDATGKTEDEMETDIQMAVQVRLYRARRARFDAAHMRHFWKLAAEPGFTGSLKCGVELARAGQTDEMDGSAEETGAVMELDPGTVAADAQEVAMDARRCGAEMAEDDEGDDARDEAMSGLLYRISMLATDDMPQDGAEE